MANEQRLIDANAPMATLERYVNPMPGESGNGFLSGLATAMDEIEAAPTVDAVPVVRCKDCKHWEDGYFGYCTKNHTAMDYDAFCSYGERKDNERKAD